jgi:ATP/maltotriose-dependent transcriptional regulator MalT
VRAERVECARLLVQLDGLLRPEVRLALVSAPAGLGKTSPLAEWLHQQARFAAEQRPVAKQRAAAEQRAAAWLALDAGDNSPDLFFAYLTAAVERIFCLSPALVKVTTREI